MAWKLALPGIVMGMVLASYGLQLCYIQYRMRTWPTTEATIRVFDPHDEHENWDGDWYASPQVEFEYVIDGQRYISTTLNPDTFNYQSRKSLARDTAGFHPGARTNCFYNPRNPSHAYLVNRGITVGPVFWTLVGIAVIAGFTVPCLGKRFPRFISR